MTLPFLAKVFYLVFYSVRFVEATITHSFAESLRCSLLLSERDPQASRQQYKQGTGRSRDGTTQGRDRNTLQRPVSTPASLPGV